MCNSQKLEWDWPMARGRHSHSARKQPRQGRSQVTVDAIVTAAERVIERTGVTGLTTTAVAEIAGVSIGSLYQYFPNREAILGAVVERALDRVFDLARTTLEATKTLSIP